MLGLTGTLDGLGQPWNYPKTIWASPEILGCSSFFAAGLKKVPGRPRIHPWLLKK